MCQKPWLPGSFPKKAARAHQSVLPAGFATSQQPGTPLLGDGELSSAWRTGRVHPSRPTNPPHSSPFHSGRTVPTGRPSTATAGRRARPPRPGGRARRRTPRRDKGKASAAPAGLAPSAHILSLSIWLNRSIKLCPPEARATVTVWAPRHVSAVIRVRVTCLLSVVPAWATRVVIAAVWLFHFSLGCSVSWAFQCVVRVRLLFWPVWRLRGSYATTVHCRSVLLWPSAPTCTPFFSAAPPMGSCLLLLTSHKCQNAGPI